MSQLQWPPTFSQFPHTNLCLFHVLVKFYPVLLLFTHLIFFYHLFWQIRVLDLSFGSSLHLSEHQPLWLKQALFVQGLAVRILIFLEGIFTSGLGESWTHTHLIWPSFCNQFQYSLCVALFRSFFQPPKITLTAVWWISGF